MRTTITANEMIDALIRELCRREWTSQEVEEQLGGRLRLFFPSIQDRLAQPFTLRLLLEVRRDFKQFQIDQGWLGEAAKVVIARYEHALADLATYIAEIGMTEQRCLDVNGFSPDIVTLAAEGAITLAEVLARQPHVVFKHDV